MRQITRSATAVALISLSGMSAADYTFTTGAEYTSGDYGMSVDTTAWYIPFTLRYTGERTAFSVTVPYVSVTGSTQVSGVRSSSLPGPGGVKTQTITTTSTEERTDAGLGDVTVSGSYQLQPESPSTPWLAVTAKAKLATASKSKNLGTGENDYALQLEAAKGAVDGLLGYHVLGDTGTVDFDNIFYGAVAYSVPLEDSWNVRTELYMEQAAVSGVDPVQEVSVSFTKPLSTTRDVNLYVVKGLSDSSPEWGLGVLLSSKF